MRKAFVFIVVLLLLSLTRVRTNAQEDPEDCVPMVDEFLRESVEFLERKHVEKRAVQQQIVELLAKHRELEEQIRAVMEEYQQVVKMKLPMM
jgi:hypothetical protein